MWGLIVDFAVGVTDSVLIFVVDRVDEPLGVFESGDDLVEDTEAVLVLVLVGVGLTVLLLNTVTELVVDALIVFDVVIVCVLVEDPV